MGNTRASVRGTGKQVRLSRFLFYIICSPHRESAGTTTEMKSIGQLIKEELERQERPVSWFARKLYIDRSSVYRLFQKNSIDTALLKRISIILNKDFFAILSQDYSDADQ